MNCLPDKRDKGGIINEMKAAKNKMFCTKQSSQKLILKALEQLNECKSRGD